MILTVINESVAGRAFEVNGSDDIKVIESVLYKLSNEFPISTVF